MGLKCRLLGHQYGDPEIERDREERGDEVVVTIREIQVCQQCGAEHVVSENKEVTTIRSAQEVGLDRQSDAAPEAADPAAADDAPAGPETSPVDDPDARVPEAESEGDAPNPFSPEAAGDVPDSTETADAPDAAPDPEAETDADSESFNDDDFEPPSDPEEDDAVILGEEDTERDETQWPEDAGADPATAARESAAGDPPARDPTARDPTMQDAAAEESADGQPVPTDPPAEEDEPVTDDAEFIDADEEAADIPGDRGHGEWPERTDLEERQTTWPVQNGEDEGFDAEPSDGAPAEVSFGGLAPEANGRSSDGADRGSSDAGTAAADESTSAEPREDRPDVPDDRVEFYCPNCGHARGAGVSSMRAGDICPECRQGYIGERRL
ncbi:hypothetical protein NDI76_02710 [Halogeometricum sp. S1BR25-6]|uniref:Oxidoreductase n=1 Tax=Halogeometricum salsisoli TaxID=2950536 RepID=A0ABU2GA23_9EURY|nr:hypothetical protein [Halogeometricum sp. S1BR25-6]MDS0297650.1 hypothetical protein [Halogeometricum sp. S1BR25-6]